jgi:hypothetical protein
MSAPNIKVMVDDYIESVTDERLPDGMYHPSSMWGCDRKTIYEIRGTIPTNLPDAKAKRRFYIGHRLHEAVQRTLESHPDVEEFYPEGEILFRKYNTIGHFDGLVKYMGEWWLLEVKSIKRWAAKRGLPKTDHVKQAITYWWCIENDGWENADGVRFPPQKLAGIIMLYVEKEDLDIWQFDLTPEPEWSTMVPEKIASLDLYREDTDSLPPRLPRDSKGKKNWLCGYCPFADKCWNIDPDEIPYEVEDF